MALTKKEKTLELVNAPVELDLSVDIKLPRLNKLKDKKYVCTCCGNSWNTQTNYFTKSSSPLYQSNGGYINICNDCRDRYFYNLVSLYNGNEAHAIRHICQQFDIIFNADCVNASKAVNGKSVLSAYMRRRNLTQISSIGSTYIDGMKHDYSLKDNEIIETLEDAKESSRTKLKTIKFFGTGFSDDDYAYLQDQYSDWTSRCECKTKAQEEVFKRICFKQLEILKATRDRRDTKDLDKTLQEYMDTAGIKPKQNNTDSLSDAQTFGTLLAKWENEKPLPEVDEELKDVDKIGLYIDVFFRGHLAKMMGLKNGLSHLYNRFIKKYTVEKPEYEGDEDNEALFDAIFGSRSDDE